MIEAVNQIALDQEAVVDAACRLVERVGARELTMRMLAQELGASTMAAYRHVPSKRALLLLVADAIVGRVEVPPPDAGDWETRLLKLELAAFHELCKVPDLLDLLPDESFPSRERLTSAVVDILLEAGFDPRTAALAHEMFFGYVQGQLKMRRQLEARPRQPERRPAAAPGKPEVLLGSVVVDGREQVIDFEEYFDFGLRVILAGLRQQLQRTSCNEPAADPGPVEGDGPAECAGPGTAV